MFLVFCTKKQTMHRQLVNVLPMSYEAYEEMMLEMPQDMEAEDLSMNGWDRPRRRARVAVAANFPVPTLMTPNKQFVPTPWRRTSCALCSSELDCRLKDEYCASDGCCRKGECMDNSDCEEQDSLNQYYRVDNFDSLGSDINPLNPQNDLSLTKKLCDESPNCVGYNSYGLLKYTIRPPDLWTPQPPLEELTPWSLYIKKSATVGKSPKVNLPSGIKQFCKLTTPPSPQFATPTGRCHNCLGCASDDECPDATVCNMASGCCVNNPCFVASPLKGRWVDGRYVRENACDCPGGEPYCCLANEGDQGSAYCSSQPCELSDHVRACSYICEDPTKQHDAVMCKGNERCCNTRGGPPTCCAASSDCAMDAKVNQCSTTPVKLTECAAAAGSSFKSVMCKPSEICCNGTTIAPPVCCAFPSLGCYTGGEINGCNYSDLTT
jgi:hypothetical protein